MRSAKATRRAVRGLGLHGRARHDLHLRAGLRILRTRQFGFRAGHLLASTVLHGDRLPRLPRGRRHHLPVGVPVLRAQKGHFTPEPSLRLRGRRLVLALRRRGVVVPIHLRLHGGAPATRRWRPTRSGCGTSQRGSALRLTKIRFRLEGFDGRLARAVADLFRPQLPLPAMRASARLFSGYPDAGGQTLRGLRAWSLARHDSGDGPAVFVMFMRPRNRHDGRRWSDFVWSSAFEPPHLGPRHCSDGSR